ncbi:hypothetical protein ACSBR2_020239 [Camellia fascicularis]
MAATRSSPRTPSKHKGVGQLPTEGLPDYIDLSHKATWDCVSTEIFLECVREQILAGRRLGTTISVAGYKEISVQFAQRTVRRHDMKQFKNKYLVLKKEWQAWNKLMDTSKGVTGIGFDRSTGLFTASDEWSENLKSTNKLAYKFKTKPLEHEDLMREVFTGATATGKHHWTPGEQVVDIADGESDSADSPGLQPFTAPYEPVVDSPPPSPIVQVDETEQGSKRKKGASTSKKSKKPSTGVSVLVDSFNHLSQAVRSQKHLTIWHGTGASQKYGIEACMQRIMAIPDFLSTPLFHFACIALENADYREILMCMPDDALCHTLRRDFGLRVPKRPHGLHIEESVAMFIHTLAGYQNQSIQERFQHSGETISRHFHAVLDAMKLFTEQHCKPTRAQTRRYPKLRSRGKYILFKNCIGALDGTHVETVFPVYDAGTYYGRKGYPTQNILTVADFDMCFIFISCGWDGSMHDSRIFKEVIENQRAPFPHP